MDLANLFSSLNIDFKRHGENSEVTERWIGVRCPYCSPFGDRFKLGFPIGVPWTGSCWTCGKMKLWDFLVAVGVSHEECKRRLGTLDRGLPDRREAPGRLVIPAGVEPMGKAHRACLKRRGLDPDVIESLWGVQGIAKSPKLAWRLFIPIRWRGKAQSWTTRAISDENKPKYLTAKPHEEAISSKELLYGHDLANHACIVVEGPGDAWRIGPGAVATLGVAYSKAQVLKLSRFSLRIIAFDNDPKAQQRANILAGQLSVFDGETVIARLDSADPGSASQREVNELRRMLK